jgi:hypothetical protein
VRYPHCEAECGENDQKDRDGGFHCDCLQLGVVSERVPNEGPTEQPVIVIEVRKGHGRTLGAGLGAVDWPAACLREGQIHCAYLRDQA